MRAAGRAGPGQRPGGRQLLGLALLAFGLPALAADGDTRQPVELPAPMREHMLANMRDHLAAIGEVQRALGQGAFGQAAEIAEHRLGMSSLDAHGASHMAPLMPEGMRVIGTRMHQAASRFAAAAQESEVKGDLAGALRSLSEVTEQCVACHATYRVH